MNDKPVVVPASVTLDKTTADVNVGAKLTLKATVLPADAANKTVTWKSSAEANATVNASGEVTGVKAGTAEITATTHNGKSAKCVVTVKVPNVPVTGVTLNKTTEEVEVGKDVTLTATVAPAGATNKAVTWKSSDDATASVVNGKVTGKKEGKATITVTTTDGAKTATCEVTVKPQPALDSIQIEGAGDVQYLKKDSTKTLKVTTTPEGADWKVDEGHDKSVVEVSKGS